MLCREAVENSINDGAVNSALIVFDFITKSPKWFPLAVRRLPCIRGLFFSTNYIGWLLIPENVVQVI